MVQNGEKWSKMVKNCQNGKKKKSKWPKTVKLAKNSQNGLKWSKMVPNGPKWSNMVKNCQYGPNGLKWSKMVKNGQEHIARCSYYPLNSCSACIPMQVIHAIHVMLAHQVTHTIQISLVHTLSPIFINCHQF